MNIKLEYKGYIFERISCVDWKCPINPIDGKEISCSDCPIDTPHKKYCGINVENIYQLSIKLNKWKGLK